MLRRVLLARSRASLMAASKPSGETALISYAVFCLKKKKLLPACATKKPFGTRAGSQAKGPSSERMSASEMIPTSLSPSTTRMRSSSCCSISWRASFTSWSGPIVTSSRVAMSSTLTELGSRPSATTRAIMSRSVTIATGLSLHYRQRSLLLLDHPPSCIHYARAGLDCDHAGDHQVPYLRHLAHPFRFLACLIGYLPLFA